jgi:CelD/BcsL family acetyltransferase involved in cellulose biosynthesis
MIPNPWMILGAIFVAVSVYFYGHHRGWDERDAEMQAEIAVKNEESRVKEQELAKQLNEQSSKLLEANNAITEKQSSLDRAIRAGRVRLPSTSCVQTNGNPPSASGNSNQAASESDTETLRLIAQIAADGDKAINQLNACIDAYQAVMEKSNGKR